LSSIKHSAAVVCDVLAEAGMLADDREPAIVRWFNAAVRDLPDQMCHELGTWFDIMRHGSATAPRRLPRADSTTDTQLRYALPVLKDWARTHDSLREISREDVLAALPPAGPQRVLMLTGLRSIFKVLKGRKLVFTNPTGWISQPSPDKPVPAPVDLAGLRRALDSPNPATALLTALLAFHAVRIYQACRIRLTDIRDGRLHIGDQVIPLAAPVRQRVTAWLDYRGRTWPESANPYLFLHPRNAGTLRPVTPWWIRHQLPIAGQHIRQDRILAEADATGGDVRALCDMFGISIASAYRYSANAAIDTSYGAEPESAGK
jgi:integrase